MGLFTFAGCLFYCVLLLIAAAVFGEDESLVSYKVRLDNEDVIDESTARIETLENWTSVLVENATLPLLKKGLIEVSYNLTQLELNRCDIRSIEPGALLFNNGSGDGVYLDELVITGNDIYSLPEGVFNNLNIRKLILPLNKIHEIESTAFDNMSSLESIDLYHNDLKSLDSSWFFQCSTLNLVNLSSNRIAFLADNAFKNIVSNENLTLDLSINIIKEVHSNTFGVINSIEFLDLSRNKIQLLDQDLFVNKTIRRMDVTNNNLSCLPDTLFSQHHIRWFSIKRNPEFRCECLRKVENWSNATGTDVFYPAIICEDKADAVNIVYNENRIFRIPLMLSTSEFSGFARKT